MINKAFSSPAVRVEACEPMPNTTARFSRSLDERNPHIRSSAAWIESMPDDQPLHPADRIVLIGCALACVALAVIFTFEWIYLP